MAKMAVVAHGGAGPGPERQANLQVAVDVASKLLLSGASAVEAAVEACVILEDDPVFNAGTGGVFRIDGSVLLEASIQTSDGGLGFYSQCLLCRHFLKSWFYLSHIIYLLKKLRCL